MNRLIHMLGTVACCIALVASSTTAQEVSSAATSDQESPQMRALLAVRDSVTRVRTEVARFRRDLSLAAGPTVVSRAGRLTEACEGLLAAFATSRPGRDLPSDAPAPRRTAAEALRNQVVATQAVVRTECRTGLRSEGPGAWPDSLKAWGPHRTSRIEQSLVDYEKAATQYARAFDLQYPPKPR